MIIIIILLIVIGLIWGFVSLCSYCDDNRRESERKQKEKRRNDRFNYQLKRFENGDFENVILYQKWGDGTTVIANISEAIQNNSPKSIQIIAKENPETYSRIKPSLPNAYASYAKQLFNKKKFSSALKWFKMSYDLKQDNSLCSYLGFCYLKAGDYSNAMFYLKEALKYKKTFSVLYNLLICSVHQQQYREALGYFKELKEKFATRLERKEKFLTKITLEQLAGEPLTEKIEYSMEEE